MEFSFFDSLIDSAIVINEERKIIYCNEVAAGMAGSSVRRLSKGVLFSEVFLLGEESLFPMSGGPEGRETPAPLREMDFAIKGQERSGKVQVTVQPFVAPDGLKLWVIILHDVTLEETLHKKYQGELEQKEGYIQELQQAKAQLENYSRNLEQMVEERTTEVRHANRMLNAIMNSLGQGFLVFDSRGVCSSIYTKACEDILESIPTGQYIWDVLRLSSGDQEQFQMWMQAAFSEALPFDSMVDLAPTQYHHTGGRHVTLNYYPLRGDTGAIGNLVLVATDRTKEHEAQMALAKEQQFIRMVLKVIKNRDQFSQFLKSAREMIQTLKLMANRSAIDFDFAEAFRVLHTIEGESGLFGAASIRQGARSCQEVIEPIKHGESADRDEVLSRLKMELAELEIALDDFLKENRELMEILKVGQNRKVEMEFDRLRQFAQFLNKSHVSPEVEKRFAEDILRQPLTPYLQHYNEVAQHVAQVQGKLLRAVEFDCDGVRIIPDLYQNVFSSLVHAFRNAVDHGIEEPMARLEAGKPEAGRIAVVADELPGLINGESWFRLVIQDDGAGINPGRLRQKLLERYPEGGFENMPEAKMIQGIFLPGFSSRDGVGQFSGRGIGMDAIKTEVERLGGSVRVESEVGKGTRLIIELPNFAFRETFALSA